MDKKLKAEIQQLLNKWHSQSMAGVARRKPPFPVDLHCGECGEVMREGFETVEAAMECIELWSRWHGDVASDTRWTSVRPDSPGHWWLAGRGRSMASYPPRRVEVTETDGVLFIEYLPLSAWAGKWLGRIAQPVPHVRMIPVTPRKLRKGEKLAEQPELFKETI